MYIYLKVRELIPFIADFDGLHRLNNSSSQFSNAFLHL